jgi:hypothetical protein
MLTLTAMSGLQIQVQHVAADPTTINNLEDNTFNENSEMDSCIFVFKRRYIPACIQQE